MLKTVFGALGVIAVLLALTWLAQGNEFFMYKVFAPARENVRREVFENTKSYNQGMVQQIRGYMASYAQADSSQKDALASVIVHETADYDETKLPADCQTFIAQLRQKQLQ